MSTKKRSPNTRMRLRFGKEDSRFLEEQRAKYGFDKQADVVLRMVTDARLAEQQVHRLAA